MNLNTIKAFVKKEFKQIIRDNSSILIAFILPVILLFLFGFGINFDTNTVKIGAVDLDNTPSTREIVQFMANTKYLDCIYYKTTKDAAKSLSGGTIKGYFVIPVNFTKEFKKGSAPKIQIITDGSEPNTAKFVASYTEGSVQTFLEYEKSKTAPTKSVKIKTIIRPWYNPALISRHFILPGSLAIIMTMTGCVLSALVIAREWERGTMEVILTTEITKLEFILSKYFAYFILGILSIIFCLFLIIVIFKVPYRGSYITLLIISALFMLTSIGSGLLVSTVFKDQFTASQTAGTIGFMPSMMLSGLIYEIDSMPLPIRVLSEVIPAKYYVSSITSLFLTGNVYKTLILNSLYLLFFSIFIFILIYKATPEVIEEC